MYNKSIKNLLPKRSNEALLLCSFLTLTQMACSAATTSSSSLNLSGTLSTAAVTSGTSSLVATNGLHRRTSSTGSLLDISRGGLAGQEAVDYSALIMSCTSQDGKSTTSTGKVSSDGTFSLPITSGANTPISCILVNGAGTSMGALVVANSSSKDMSGKNSSTSDQFKASGTTTLGAISYDPTTQEAIASSSNISGLVKDTLTAATAFDPTGSYAITAADTLDPGFRTICAAGHTDNTCNGPSAGDLLYINRLVGTNNSDSSPVFGIQLWQSEAAKTACGNMTGLSTAQANEAGVTITSGGTAGAFAFKTSGINYTSPLNSSSITGDSLTAGYKLTSAKTLWPMQPACSPKNVTVAGINYNAWVCTQGGLYQSNLSGGCTDASNNPVNVKDWSSINTCPAGTLDSATGYTTQTCTGTYNSVAVTCKNVFGTFSNAALTTPTGSAFDWTTLNASQIASGTLCSTLTGLSQVQCYAQWYQQALGNDQNGSSACYAKVQTDWTSTDPATFVNVDYKPNGLIFMDKLDYQVSDSGVQAAVMRTAHDEYRGVPSDSNGNKIWVPCKVHEASTLRMTKIDSTHLKMTYISNTITPDTGKAACVAAFGKAGSSAAQKFQFTVTKQ